MKTTNLVILLAISAFVGCGVGRKTIVNCMIPVRNFSDPNGCTTSEGSIVSTASGTWEAYASTAKIIPATTDGEIRFTIGASLAVGISIDNQATNRDFNLNQFFLWVSGDGKIWYYNGVNVPTSTGIAAVSGNILAINRTAGAVKYRHSDDGGDTFTTLATPSNSATTVALYPSIRANGSAKTVSGIKISDTAVYRPINLLYVGNSLTNGTGGTTQYSTVVETLLESTFPGITFTSSNTAVGGQTTLDIDTNYTTQVSSEWDNGKFNVCVAWEIRNHLVIDDPGVATAQSEFQDLCERIQGSKFTTIAVSLLPSWYADYGGDATVTGYEQLDTDRLAVNVWLKANYTSFATGLAKVDEIDGLANLGDNEQDGYVFSATRPTESANGLYDDGTHLTDAGYALVAASVADQIAIIIEPTEAIEITSIAGAGSGTGTQSTASIGQEPDSIVGSGSGSGTQSTVALGRNETSVAGSGLGLGTVSSVAIGGAVSLTSVSGSGTGSGPQSSVLLGVAVASIVGSGSGAGPQSTIAIGRNITSIVGDGSGLGTTSTVDYGAAPSTVTINRNLFYFHNLFIGS